ncbi:hypothetical protein MHBO_005292 [Bonamia ostreae]|uniref:Uncharacterized protein n=1 Tax=Bonamia ostreae TaxID=126728 RepID=A0ABV2AIL5_9EUKA
MESGQHLIAKMAKSLKTTDEKMRKCVLEKNFEKYSNKEIISIIKIIESDSKTNEKTTRDNILKLLDKEIDSNFPDLFEKTVTKIKNLDIKDGEKENNEDFYLRKESLLYRKMVSSLQNDFYSPIKIVDAVFY